MHYTFCLHRSQKQVCVLGYLVAMPRHGLNFMNAFLSRWRSGEKFSVPCKALGQKLLSSATAVRQIIATLEWFRQTVPRGEFSQSSAARPCMHILTT